MPHEARQLASTFIGNLQASAPAVGASADQWINLRDGTFERAYWVTRELLVSLLPLQAFRACVGKLAAAPRSKRNRAVLRCHNPFIGIVDGEREFELVRVVSRAAVLEEVTASLGEEPEPS